MALFVLTKTLTCLTGAGGEYPASDVFFTHGAVFSTFIVDRFSVTCLNYSLVRETAKFR